MRKRCKHLPKGGVSYTLDCLRLSAAFSAVAKQAKAIGAKLKLQRTEDDDDEEEEEQPGEHWGGNKKRYYDADTMGMEVRREGGIHTWAFIPECPYPSIAHLGIPTWASTPGCGKRPCWGLWVHCTGFGIG